MSNKKYLKLTNTSGFLLSDYTFPNQENETIIILSEEENKRSGDIKSYSYHPKTKKD